MAEKLPIHFSFWRNENGRSVFVSIMSRIGTTSLLVMSLAALHANALEVREAPYDRIAERNVFQLHGPPVVTVEAIPKPQLRKATLTGIITILGRPVAFITIEGIRSQPPDSIMMGEGQALNGIEVKAVDEKAGMVRILNGDELQILNFEMPKSSGAQPNPGSIIPQASAPSSKIPQTMMTPEEQTALIELQRIKFQREGNPAQAILPPTELTSNVNEPPVR